MGALRFRYVRHMDHRVFDGSPHGHLMRELGEILASSGLAAQ
jgi:hypothetical protein